MILISNDHGWWTRSSLCHILNAVFQYVLDTEECLVHVIDLLIGNDRYLEHKQKFTMSYAQAVV